MSNPYVTEAYLQKQVEQRAALQIGRVMLNLAFGYGGDIAHVVGAYADPDYVKNGRINVSVRSKVKRWRHGKPVYVHEFASGSRLTSRPRPTIRRIPAYSTTVRRTS